MNPFCSARWTTQQHRIMLKGTRRGAERRKGAHLWVSQLHLATGWQELIKARASASATTQITRHIFPKRLDLFVWFKVPELSLIHSIVVMSASNNLTAVITFHFMISKVPYWKEINDCKVPSWEKYLFLCVFVYTYLQLCVIYEQAGRLCVGQGGQQLLELDAVNDSLKLWGSLLWQTAESMAEQCHPMTAHHVLWPNTDT